MSPLCSITTLSRLGDPSDIARLPEVNARIGARLAIIAVPANAAQTVADQLVEAGITGILNFAPTVLKVPPHVFVRNVSFLQELAVLSYHVAETESPPHLIGGCRHSAI
ncbi:MAG: hypothetical protein C4336_06270 [Armatimonadota bacterium]